MVPIPWVSSNLSVHHFPCLSHEGQPFYCLLFAKCFEICLYEGALDMLKTPLLKMLGVSGLKHDVLSESKHLTH